MGRGGAAPLKKDRFRVRVFFFLYFSDVSKLLPPLECVEGYYL
jgi:hypothetical protein